MIESDNMNDIYRDLVDLLKRGRVVSPRGKEVREELGVGFTLLRPRNRIINNSYRQPSYTFGVGEFMWYLSGSNSLRQISYYSSIYPKFSDNGKTLNGAYGPRIFGTGANLSQWENVKRQLVEDNDSRRAVVAIFNRDDLKSPSKDIPCSCILQYFIRDKKLYAITYMRSNDIYLGLPYDVFSFTLLQEILAAQLGVRLGNYTHVVGSLHNYSEHYDLFNKEWASYPIKKVPQIVQDDVTKDAIMKAISAERKLRFGISGPGKSLGNINSEFWEFIFEILVRKAQRGRVSKDK